MESHKFLGIFWVKMTIYFMFSAPKNFALNGKIYLYNSLCVPQIII